MARARWRWFFGAALLAAVAHAEPTPLATVSIVDAGSPALARKLRAEAAYAGFDEVRSGNPGEAPEPEMAPLAVIRVMSANRVELSVAAFEGPGRSMEFARAEGEGDSFALRVIEQLRASLLDLGWDVPAQPGAAGAVPAARADDEAMLSGAAAPSPPASPRAAEASAPPASVATEPPRRAGADALSGDALGSSPASRSLLALDAGMAASWATGGSGVAPHALLGLRGSQGGWGASLTALLPLAGSDITAPEGEAHVSWHSFSAGLERELPLSAAWFASGGLGAGLLLIDVRGEARPEFVGRHERLLTGSYFIELCTGRRLSSSVMLRATLRTGLAAPRPVVAFDGHDVASVGRLFGVLALSADIGLIQAPSEPP